MSEINKSKVYVNAEDLIYHFNNNIVGKIKSINIDDFEKEIRENERKKYLINNNKNSFIEDMKNEIEKHDEYILKDFVNYIKEHQMSIDSALEEYIKRRKYGN